MIFVFPIAAKTFTSGHGFDAKTCAFPRALHSSNTLRDLLHVPDKTACSREGLRYIYVGSVSIFYCCYFVLFFLPRSLSVGGDF